MDEFDHHILAVVRARVHADGAAEHLTANKTTIMTERLPAAITNNPPALRHLFEDSCVYQHALQRKLIASTT